MKITISQEGTSPISITVPDNINNKPEVKSQEGFISNYKDNAKFIQLYKTDVLPVIIKLRKELGYVNPNLRFQDYTCQEQYFKPDYMDFYKAKKSDKTMNAEKYIKYLIDDKYSIEKYKKRQKENEAKERAEKNKLPENIEKEMHSRIEDLANKSLIISKEIISHIKTNLKIKEFFNNLKRDNKKYSNINYLKYIEKIPSKEEIISQINMGIKYDLNNKKNVNDIKLDYTIYIVDMEEMRSDYDDIYDDVGDEIYDIFEDNLPKINANPFDCEIGGLGWESITATLSEK